MIDEEILIEHEHDEVEEERSSDERRTKAPYAFENQNASDLGRLVNGRSPCTADDQSREDFKDKGEIKSEHVPGEKGELRVVCRLDGVGDAGADEEVELQTRESYSVNDDIGAAHRDPHNQEHKERRAEDQQVEEREAPISGKGREVRSAVKEDEEGEGVPD